MNLISSFFFVIFFKKKSPAYSVSLHLHAPTMIRKTFVLKEIGGRRVFSFLKTLGSSSKTNKSAKSQKGRKPFAAIVLEGRAVSEYVIGACK